MGAEPRTTQEDQEAKDRARLQLGRERARALALARLLDRVLARGSSAHVYGRMADGSIYVEQWKGGDQMPLARWRVTLAGEVVDSNEWLE